MYFKPVLVIVAIIEFLAPAGPPPLWLPKIQGEGEWRRRPLCAGIHLIFVPYPLEMSLDIYQIRIYIRVQFYFHSNAWTANLEQKVFFFSIEIVNLENSNHRQYSPFQIRRIYISRSVTRWGVLEISPPLPIKYMSPKIPADFFVFL